MKTILAMCFAIVASSAFAQQPDWGRWQAADIVPPPSVPITPSQIVIIAPPSRLVIQPPVPAAPPGWLLIGPPAMPTGPYPNCMQFKC